MSVLERVRYLKVGKISLEAPSNWAPPVWFIRKEGPILNEQTCPMSPTTREPGEGRGRSGHSYCQRIPLFLRCTRESVNTFAEWFFRRLHSSHGNPPPNRLLVSTPGLATRHNWPLTVGEPAPKVPHQKLSTSTRLPTVLHSTYSIPIVQNG
jgi:hypothetical protein